MRARRSRSRTKGVRPVSSTPVKVIRMRDYGPRMRTAVHAQQVHDQIAQALKASSRVRLDFADIESVGETFLDRSLGALVAWHGATVFRSLVFAHCSPSVDRKSTRLNSSHDQISYAVFCLKKKKSQQ